MVVSTFFLQKVASISFSYSSIALKFKILVSRQPSNEHPGNPRITQKDFLVVEIPRAIKIRWYNLKSPRGIKQVELFHTNMNREYCIFFVIPLFLEQ